MSRRLSPNRAILQGMAVRIRPLLDEVVFVGGQVVELLLTDPAATRARATTDVDVVVAARTRSEYHRVGERLRDLGFGNDQTEGAPICRWKSSDGLILDLMPVNEDILGFSNQWYPAALERTVRHDLADGLIISVPRPAVFLATKFAAFLSRGSDDLLLSHDLEDIVTLVAGRPELCEELRSEPQEIREWLSSKVAALLEDPEFEYALTGALPDAARLPDYRMDVRARFQAIASVGP